jgi:hypothetical protein
MNILSVPVDAARFASGASLEAAERVYGAVAGGTDLPSNITETKSAGPSIYAIAEPMLDLSGIIYAFVELRKEAKERLFVIAKEKNLCTDIDDLFSDPTTRLAALRNAIEASVDALKVFEKTGDSMAGANYRKFLAEIESLKKKFEISDGDVELCKDYFHVLSLPKTADDMKADFILHSDWMKAFIIVFGGEESNLKPILDCCDKDPTAYVVKVDDEHTTSGGPFEQELTFAIAVSDKFKGIYVIFRGSVAANDWLANVQANAVDFLLPGFTSGSAKNNKQQNFGKVHGGFYKYLFDETNQGISKGEEIMGAVASLMQKNKGYSLHITGHSLGGALSTMMAFRAAALGDLTDAMVMNVSFASPFVGDQEFRDNFVAMEKKNKIKHLRVSNYKDVVPLIPFMTVTSPFCMTYKHVGMNLRLYKSGFFDFLTPEYRIFYPKEDSVMNELRNAFHTNLLIGISIFSIPYHLCPEYTARLESASEKLKNVTLDELYSNEKITGWTYE